MNRTHALRGDLPLITAIELKMEGLKKRGRPRQPMLDRMVADGYEES